MARRPLGLAIVIVISALVGCGGSNGPATQPASGQILFKDGQPVRTGQIELLSEDGKWTANGQIDREGNFVLGTKSVNDGAVSGVHKVIVKQFFIPGHPIMSLENAGPPVHPQVTEFRTTTLEVKITEGKRNRLKIVVDPDPNYQPRND